MNILQKIEEVTNISKTELAKILEISKSNYSDLYRDIENGKILSIKNALKLQEHFGISLDEIYGIISPEERQQGIVDSLSVHINTLQSKLLDIFDEIGEKLGENGQKAYIGIGESIIQNITK